MINSVNINEAKPKDISFAHVHGVFLEILGQGVLLTGRSGIGKSEAALALLDRGGSLVSDDIVMFRLSSCGKQIFGTCPSAEFKGCLEVRGLGIVNVQYLFGANVLKAEASLSLICQLVSASIINRAERIESRDKILGVFVPKIILPVSPGRNLALLIETLVRTQA